MDDKKPKVKYFKTYAEAQAKLPELAGVDCTNKYQYAGECKELKIVEYTKGFAIQFGDCGAYLSED